MLAPVPVVHVSSLVALFDLTISLSDPVLLPCYNGLTILESPSDARLRCRTALPEEQLAPGASNLA